MQQFHCPYCRLLLMDDGQLAGSHVFCPECSGEFYIPNSSTLPVVLAPPLPKDTLPPLCVNNTPINGHLILDEPRNKAPSVINSIPHQGLWRFITIGVALLAVITAAHLNSKRTGSRQLSPSDQSERVDFQQDDDVVTSHAESMRHTQKESGEGYFNSAAFGQQLALRENLTDEYRARGIALEEVLFILATIVEYDRSPKKIELVLNSWPLLVDAMGGKHQFDKAMRGSELDFSIITSKLTSEENKLAKELRSAYKSWLPDVSTRLPGAGHEPASKGLRVIEFEMDESAFSPEGLARKRAEIAKYERLSRLYIALPASAKLPVLPLTEKESEAMFAITEMRQKDYANETIDAELASRDLLGAASQVRARQQAEKLFQNLEHQRQIVANATNCRVLKDGDRTVQIFYPLGRKSDPQKPTTFGLLLHARDYQRPSSSSEPE